MVPERRDTIRFDFIVVVHMHFAANPMFNAVINQRFAQFPVVSPWCSMMHTVMQVGFAMLEVGSISPKNTKVRIFTRHYTHCTLLFVSPRGHIVSVLGAGDYFAGVGGYPAVLFQFATEAMEKTFPAACFSNRACGSTR